MFGSLGQMASLLKNLPKMQASMAEFQARLGEMFAEGRAGGDMVIIKVNGRMELTSVVIHPDALADREALEDLIFSATNQALAKIRELVATETSKMAQGLPL